MIHSLALAGLALLSAGGAIADWRSSRIPNWLTGSGAALAVGLAAAQGTLAATLLSMAMILVPFAAARTLGGMGGGDVKMAVALAGLASVPAAIPGAILAVLLGTMAGLVQAALAGLIPQAAALAALGGEWRTARAILRAGDAGARAAEGAGREGEDALPGGLVLRRDVRRAGRAARTIPYGVSLGAGGILAAAILAAAPGFVPALFGW